MLITCLLLVLEVCNVKQTYRKSWTGNLLMWSGLTLSSSFKVKRGQPNLKVLITRLFFILEVCNVKPFYCEKYTYHFLTIAICWCHPTHWPTLRNVLRYLKRPVSECELACPPSGHVTTLVNNLHYFCWPS